jgi:hypothetical protein
MTRDSGPGSSPAPGQKGPLKTLGSRKYFYSIYRATRTDLQTRPYLFDDFLKAGLPHP